MEVFSLLCLIAIFIGPLMLGGFVGWLIGSKRNNADGGFLWGFLLGPFGWIMAAIIDHRPRCPECREPFQPGARICPHCRQPMVLPSLPQPPATSGATKVLSANEPAAGPTAMGRIAGAVSSGGNSLLGGLGRLLAAFDRQLRCLAGPENQIVYGFLAILSYVAVPLALLAFTLTRL